MHLLLILTSSIKQVQTHSQNSSLLIIHIFIFRIRIINETLSDPKTAVTLQTSAGTESKHSPRTLQAKYWIKPAICVSLPLLHGHLKHKYLLSWFGKYSTYTVYIPVLTNKISQTTTRGTPDSTCTTQLIVKYTKNKEDPQIQAVMSSLGQNFITKIKEINRGRSPWVVVHWSASSVGPHQEAEVVGEVVPQSSMASPWCCVGGSLVPSPSQSSDVKYRVFSGHLHRCRPQHSGLEVKKQSLWWHQKRVTVMTS